MREKLREAKRKRIKKWLYGVGIALIIVMGFYLKMFLPLWCKKASLFSVKSIIVEPQNQSSFIKTYISIPESTSILSLNLEEIYKKIRQIYFIEDCFIEKHLPDTLFIKLKIRSPWVVVADSKNMVAMDRQGIFLPVEENFKTWNIVGMFPGKIGNQTVELEKLNILKEIEQWYNYYDIVQVFPVETIFIQDINKIELKGLKGCLYIRGDEIRKQLETAKQVIETCKKNNFLFEYIDVRFEQPYVKEAVVDKSDK